MHARLLLRHLPAPGEVLMEQNSQPCRKPQGISQEHTLREEEAVVQKPSGLEFKTAEEVIRYDAERTQPPARLEHRVRESVEREGLCRRSWWRRLFGG